MTSTLMMRDFFSGSIQRASTCLRARALRQASHLRQGRFASSVQRRKEEIVSAIASPLPRGDPQTM